MFAISAVISVCCVVCICEAGILRFSQDYNDSLPVHDIFTLIWIIN